MIWETKGAGRGYSSMAVAGGRLYTMGDGLSTVDDKDEYAQCFDAGTGKSLWKTKLGAHYEYRGQENWESSRSTPTVDGDHVYYLTPLGVLACLNTADGKKLWSKDLKADFGGGKGDGWGYSESPLVDGDRLLCTPGKGKNTMVALNKSTGEKVWSAVVGDDAGAGHASIVIADVGGIRVYVQTTASYVFGVRAEDGKVLWTYPMGKEKRVTAVIPTPIIHGDMVFAVAGYNKGAALLRQVKGPDNSVKVEEVYGYNRAMANKHGGVVLIGDYVYGDKEDSGVLWCAKLSTGELQKGWSKRGSGRASGAVTAADGHLYVHYANGTLALVKASPEAYQETGSFKVPHSGSRPSWSHPVICNGRLYVREGDWIMCYDVKGSPAQ